MSIAVCELSKRFGTLPAVDRVSFEIDPGGIVGLIGPNGAGKTTILRLVSTFLAPDSGQVRVAGFDCRTQAERVRQCLGYLPETPPGGSAARVEEYLAFRARLKQVPPRARRIEVDRVLDGCHLQGVRRRLVGRLSQGFRRRVGLADALLGRPQVLLLDEPTIGLDPLQVRQTRGLLAELAERCTVVLSTHLLAEAQAVCTRVLMLLSGRLVWDAPLSAVEGQSGFEIEICGPRDACAQLLGGLPGVTRVETLSGAGPWHLFAVQGQDDLRAEAAAACCRQGWGVRTLRGRPATLEDHFVRLALRTREEAA